MTLISSALNTSSTTSVDLNLGTFLAFHEKKSNEFVSFLAAGCAGCDKEITDGQALIALDKQWHVWCFKCTSSGVLLHGEYMGRYVDDLLVLHVLVLISLSLCVVGTACPTASRSTSVSSASSAATAAATSPAKSCR